MPIPIEWKFVRPRPIRCNGERTHRGQIESLPGLRVRQLANGTTIMMRSISIAAALGLLAALPAVYFLSASRQHPAAMPAGADNAISEAAIPVEAWPICSTMGSMVETADWAALDPDFAAGKRAIVAGDWDRAHNSITFV